MGPLPAGRLARRVSVTSTMWSALLTICVCGVVRSSAGTTVPATQQTATFQPVTETTPTQAGRQGSTSESTLGPVSEVSAEPGAAMTSEPESEITSEPESKVTSEPESEMTSEPESEITSEPESEITSEPESKVTSEPEMTSEPESEITSEPESKVTSEPESEVTSEPESEITSEPESKVTSEPESEVTSEPESEITSEPESKVTSEPESEVTSEPESEITSEPESKVTSEPESEVTSEPESEITSEPESKVTSEPESEVTSEPESEITSEPESKVTSEPESEVTSEPESEITSEPESKVTSEPESEVTSEPESEITSEPESKVTSEPESEVTSEPESEITSEPESEVTSEPESEITSEPESKVTSEPESEITSEPESEITSEPEVAIKSEPESEGTSEPKSEVTAEPVSETASEPETGVKSDPESEASACACQAEPKSESEAASVPEGRPTAAEIVLPPVLLILGVIIALLVLLIKSRRVPPNDTMFGVSKTFLFSIANGKIHPEATRKHDEIKVIDLLASEETAANPLGQQRSSLTEKVVPADEAFFSEFDREVLHSLRNCYNQPKELVRIAVPAILSLALCPITLYLFDPVRNYFWPQTLDRPNINDAIACYLSPAGLVYATSFGFAFQQVLNKQHEILTKMTNEISMLDHIVTFTVKIKLSLCTKLKILQAVKTECIFMVLQVLDRGPATFKHAPTDDIKVKIWTVLDLLREVESSRKHYVDRILCEKIVSNITELNSICSDSMGILHTKIHPFKWVFLETLGFFSFLGILLLTADSYRMELVMCVITVFSISMLCYVVSDLDSPFSGFFRVDIGVLEEVLTRLDLVYNIARSSGSMDVFYPE